MNNEPKLDQLTCNEAFERLYEYLDRELAPEENDAVKRHLEVCEACFHHFEFDERLMKTIREKVQAGRAPEPIRRKISKLLEGL